jgi:predicted AlkP superfamily phosphohydrolase/phosphomutase
MKGGFCLNQWLIEQGLLVLQSKPEGVVALDRCQVDWAKTRVWGGGGYYGRLFFNLAGREPMGVIQPDEYEAFRDQLIARLEALADHEGRPMGTRAFKPQDLYRRCRGVPPDLIVYLGDLDWRAVGTLGHPGLYTFANDTGPDDANHAQEGLFIHYDPQNPGQGQRPPLAIYDIAPAILAQMGVAVPNHMIGSVPDFIAS